jgi:hypothetical protein
MTPVDTLGEPVTVVDTLGEPVVLINEDGTPAFLAYSAKTYLGGVTPYHWLDFINNRALYAGADVGNVTQATGYSFTRASDGYYTNSDGTLTNFASGALRRGDRGVLIEGSRTNLLTYSQQFDDASWTDANTTVSANSTNAPDGTTTADILTATTSTSVGKSKTFTGTAAAYTCSLIAKAGTSSWLRIATSNGTSTINSWFNLSSGATGTTEAGQTSTIVPLSDGYYICSVVRTMAATTCTVFYRFANADNGVTGTSGQTQTWWGAQVELGGFVSSYIPTVAAAATRAADVLSYTVNTTAQINAAVAGQPELVTNGGFATDSDWTKGTGWTIGSGVATKAAGSSSAINQTAASFTAGQLVALTVTISGRTAGSLYWRIGNTTNIGIMSVNGTITQILPASATGTYLGLFADATFDGTIDNVSVKEVPANSLTLYPLQLWSEFERAVDTGGNEAAVQLDNGSNNDRTLLYVTAGDTASVFVARGGATEAAIDVSGAIALGVPTKMAARVATDNAQIARGGNLSTEDTSVTTPASPTVLRIGADTGSAIAPFGYIRRIAVIQGAGTDANLQAMTS